MSNLHSYDPLGVDFAKVCDLSTEHPVYRAVFKAAQQLGAEEEERERGNAIAPLGQSTAEDRCLCHA